ncbi:MAG: hypothetical protein U0575_00895 [Phycisphaerales bacterium]
MPDHLNTLVLLVHACATWFMVGLIWFVQVVHYPLMGVVPDAASSAYSRAHQRRTTWIVGPVMLLEAGSAILLFWVPHGEFNATPMRCIGIALLALVWISTFAVQVPLHARLASGSGTSVIRRLVATNWLRTVAWTARGVVAIVLLG